MAMIKYCRANFGDRGGTWDYTGNFRTVEFRIDDQKEATWFYFLFAKHLRDPNKDLI
jgi:hypothetical protein